MPAATAASSVWRIERDQYSWWAGEDDQAAAPKSCGLRARSTSLRVRDVPPFALLPAHELELPAPQEARPEVRVVRAIE